VTPVNYFPCLVISLVVCVIFSTLAPTTSSSLPLLSEAAMYFMACSAFLSIIASIYFSIGYEDHHNNVIINNDTGAIVITVNVEF